MKTNVMIALAGIGVLLNAGSAEGQNLEGKPSQINRARYGNNPGAAITCLSATGAGAPDTLWRWKKYNDSDSHASDWIEPNKVVSFSVGEFSEGDAVEIQFWNGSNPVKKPAHQVVNRFGNSKAILKITYDKPEHGAKAPAKKYRKIRQ